MRGFYILAIVYYTDLIIIRLEKSVENIFNAVSLSFKTIILENK